MKVLLTHSLADSLATHSLSLLQRFIPGATLEEVRGREERYLLPLVQSRPLVMKELFECLDHRLKDLALQSYGLSACTMEEVVYSSIIM